MNKTYVYNYNKMNDILVCTIIFHYWFVEHSMALFPAVQECHSSCYNTTAAVTCYTTTEMRVCVAVTDKSESCHV